MTSNHKYCTCGLSVPCVPSYASLDPLFLQRRSHIRTYILKAGNPGNQIPQTIWIFRRKILWERKNIFQCVFLCILCIFMHFYAFLCISMHFYAFLYIFYAYSCIFMNSYAFFCRNLRTFVADFLLRFKHFFRRFLKLKSTILQTLSLLECIWFRLENVFFVLHLVWIKIERWEEYVTHECWEHLAFISHLSLFNIHLDPRILGPDALQMIFFSILGKFSGNDSKRPRTVVWKSLQKKYIISFSCF